jgi:hypothetical protein
MVDISRGYQWKIHGKLYNGILSQDVDGISQWDL